MSVTNDEPFVDLSEHGILELALTGAYSSELFDLPKLIGNCIKEYNTLVVEHKSLQTDLARVVERETNLVNEREQLYSVIDEYSALFAGLSMWHRTQNTRYTLEKIISRINSILFRDQKLIRTIKDNRIAQGAPRQNP